MGAGQGGGLLLPLGVSFLLPTTLRQGMAGVAIVQMKQELVSQGYLRQAGPRAEPCPGSQE